MGQCNFERQFKTQEIRSDQLCQSCVAALTIYTPFERGRQHWQTFHVRLTGPTRYKHLFALTDVGCRSRWMIPCHKLAYSILSQSSELPITCCGLWFVHTYDSL